MRLAGFNNVKRIVPVAGALIEPKNILGKSIQVYLNERANDAAAFYFKVTAAGEAHIDGYDAEGENLRISIQDIEYIQVSQ